jgi:hypothetical protein
MDGLCMLLLLLLLQLTERDGKHIACCAWCRDEAAKKAAALKVEPPSTGFACAAGTNVKDANDMNKHAKTKKCVQPCPAAQPSLPALSMLLGVCTAATSWWRAIAFRVQAWLWPHRRRMRRRQLSFLNIAPTCAPVWPSAFLFNTSCAHSWSLTLPRTTTPSATLTRWKRT